MKKSLIILPLLLCFTISLNGCSQKSDTTSSVEETKTATSVEVMSVTKAIIQNDYKYSGKVKPLNEVNVLSTVSGKVDKVNFDVGDIVNKDDILFTMDTADIVNNINVLKAQLVSAEASINSAKTGLDLANGSSMKLQIEQNQSNVNNAKSAYENAQLNLSNAEIAMSNAEISVNNSKLNLNKAEMAYNTAKTDYDNNKALFDIGALSQTVFDQYKTAFEQAEIAYNQAKLTYDQSQLSVEQAKVSYDQAQASVSQAEDAYNQAQSVYNITANEMPAENRRKAEDSVKVAEASRGSILAQIASSEKTLNDAMVKSPISGIVTACNVKEGTILSQGATVPFTIIDTSSVNIDVSVSEQIINSLTIGQQVDVIVSVVSQEPINAKISTINPAANNSGTYDVKIEIENSNNLLKSGMFGEVYFTREKSEDTIVVPRSSVISNDKETYVMIADGNIAKKINVTLGIDTGDEVEIIDGLEENMNIITKGQTYLSDGDSIEIVSNSLNVDALSNPTDTTESSSMTGEE